MNENKVINLMTELELLMNDSNIKVDSRFKDFDFNLITGLELYDKEYERMQDAISDNDYELAEQYQDELDEFSEDGKQSPDLFFAENAELSSECYTVDDVKNMIETLKQYFLPCKKVDTNMN